MPDMEPSPLAALPSSIQEALRAGNEGNTEKAVQLLRQAAAEHPGWGLPHFLLGAELAQAGAVADAEAAYANAVLLSPAMHIARFELGTLLFTSGRVPLALLVWQPLSDLDAADPLKLFVTGYTHLAADQTSEAVAAFQQGIAANKTNEPLNSNIRLLLARLEQASADTTTPTANSFFLSAYQQSKKH